MILDWQTNFHILPTQDLGLAQQMKTAELAVWSVFSFELIHTTTHKDGQGLMAQISPPKSVKCSKLLSAGVHHSCFEASLSSPPHLRIVFQDELVVFSWLQSMVLSIAFPPTSNGVLGDCLSASQAVVFCVGHQCESPFPLTSCRG